MLNLYFDETPSVDYYTASSPRWNPPCRGEGAYYQEASTQVRQREELVGATLRRSIRTNRSSLILLMPRT